MNYKTEPYRHQVDAYTKLYGREYGALFMEQGTGKSKVAIDISSNLFLDKEINAVLLIAPNGVQRQWIKEQIPLHSSVPYKPMLWKAGGGKLYQRLLEEFRIIPDEYNRLKWFCVNVEAFQNANHLSKFKEYLLNNKCLIVVDECTRIKNPTANRTVNITYGLSKLIKKGRVISQVIPYAKYRLILTGMMITNSPYDLWSMFEFLQHDFFKSNYYAFKAHYGIELRDTHPGTGRLFSRGMRFDEMQSIRRYHFDQGKSVETISMIMSTSESNVKFIIAHPELMAPYKNLDELKRMIEPVSFIVRKSECLDLPPKVYEKIYVEMNAEQKRIYKDLKRQLLAEYEEKELTILNKVSLIGRLQQITGGFFPYSEEQTKGIIPIDAVNPKIAALKNDLEETAGDEVIIIWARFVAELKIIAQELKKLFPNKRIELYYGGTRQEDREKIITDFKEGKIDIFIANARTAGVGLNLQRSHFQYFYSNSFSLEDREQAEDRSHRSGQISSVLYKDIIMQNTVDEQVYRVLQSKKSLLEYFRDKTLAQFITEEENGPGLEFSGEES